MNSFEFRSMVLKLVLSNIFKSKIGLKQNFPPILLLSYMFNLWLVKKKEIDDCRIINQVSSLYILGITFTNLELFFIDYFSEINSRAIAYLSTDINRCVLLRDNHINVLATMTKLNEQLPIFLMNEVNKDKNFIENHFGIYLACIDHYLHCNASSFCMELCIRYRNIISIE
jgi:hypothetical protein